MRIVSRAFADNGFLDKRFTCFGDNLNPPFDIYEIPPAAETLALTLVDLDSAGQSAHWLIWNMDTATPVIHEGRVPYEAREGTNDYGTVGYHGACPDDDTIHRYHFRVYALSDELALDDSYEYYQLMEAMEDYIITTADIMARYDKA